MFKKIQKFEQSCLGLRDSRPAITWRCRSRADGKELTRYLTPFLEITTHRAEFSTAPQSRPVTANLFAIRFGCARMIPMVLERELKCYAANRERLVAQANGQFVLVRGFSIVSIFHTEEDAFKCAYDKFGDTPFLVRRIAAKDEVLNFSSMNVAL
jgi:hypothetical protein